VNGAKRNDWLLLAQRVITLCAMDFPYRTGHAFPLFLAPMSGVSESPFRLLCRRFGADVVVSEFISAVGVARGLEHLFADMRFEQAERPIGIQLYGADATIMARAAEMVTAAVQPDFIDINFGCPVKKVVKNNGGSGCLKDLGLVQQIITTVRSATHLPVSVKIRSGWDETQRDPVAIALRCREAGAQALTLHARTRTQMFSGQANWDEIARVVEALDIPVIGNGDIATAADVIAMRRHTNCAGVMIARGAFGNPWLFAQARDLVAGRPPRPAPTATERFAVALEHARLALALQGDTRKTALEFRKHFGWYTKGVPGAGGLRERLFQIESMREAEAIFASYLAGSAVGQAA
jgi:tRNA-dihydrouridine synthase B